MTTKKISELNIENIISNEDFVEEDNVATINKNLNESKETDTYKNKIIDMVIYLNSEFAINYQDLWLSNAEDKEFLIEWIERLVEKEVSPETIKKAVNEHIEYGNEYPPNFNQFLKACKEIESFNYNLPTKEEAYMIACGRRDIKLKKSHVAVREATKRVQEYRVKNDPNIKTEFYKTYRDVCDEFVKANGEVPYNDKIENLDDFTEDKHQGPPVSKEVAKKHIFEILNRSK